MRVGEGVPLMRGKGMTGWPEGLSWLHRVSVGSMMCLESGARDGERYLSDGVPVKFQVSMNLVFSFEGVWRRAFWTSCLSFL